MMPDVIHVAVGVILGADRQILIARRPPDAHQGNLWEFPGGKLESGESVLVALQRELREELGIDIDPNYCFPLKKILHHYGDRAVLLDIWRVDRFSGEPHGRENQQVAWQSIDRLDPIEFPAANQAIIDALQLPSVVAITASCESREECRKKISALLAKKYQTYSVQAAGSECGRFSPMGKRRSAALPRERCKAVGKRFTCSFQSVRRARPACELQQADESGESAGTERNPVQCLMSQSR